MTPAATEEKTFLTNFDERHRELAGSGPDWLQELRREASARFESLGFPTSRLEEWKSTNVAPLIRTPFQPAPAGHRPAESRLPEVARLPLGGPRLVFIDGHHAPELSSATDLPDGVWVGSLLQAATTVPKRLRPYLTRRQADEGTAFSALNGSLFDDGAFVLIPRNVEMDLPVHLVYISSGGNTPSASHPRTIISAETGSRAIVVETYCGIDEGVYLTNALTDTFICDNASVDHYRLQCESPGAFHVSTSKSHQTRHSIYVNHNIDLGAVLARHDAVAVIDGEGADCRLNGLYMTHGKQHVDNQTVLDHARPHGDSREVYKGILDDSSRAVFNGRIVVREGAQKTDAKQSNPNLLLSEGALAHTRPQLEIYADDVKCTHGATVGRMSDDAIFYLQSRGIPRSEARDLMIEAFAGEVIDLIEIETLRNFLGECVSRRLAGRRNRK